MKSKANSVDILKAIDDPKVFGGWFRDHKTWGAWRAFLAALFARPMDADQQALYREFTGRLAPPTTEFDEAYLICGRRGGKSAILAVTAVYLAVFRNYKPLLAPGEVATIRIMAADRDQARSIFRYIGALLKENVMLARLIDRETAESFELSNRVVLEVGTASFRSSRGYTYAAVLADELAFWRSDESTNPDIEILRALRPGLLTIPGAKLLCASSPYARRGALWEAFQRFYGKDDAGVLVWKAPTRAMNPTVSQADIDAEMERDPASAAAEYLAEFRTDVESFISIEAVRGCIRAGVRERPAERRWRYYGFCDPSGGSNNSMTLAISHKEGSTCILDAIREVRPPFSPEATVEEFARLLRSYRVTTVFGDRYSGEWCREQFRRHQINYEPAGKSKSDLYLDFLPLLNSNAVDLLDNDRMLHQLVHLSVARPAAAGTASITAVAGMTMSLTRSWRRGYSCRPACRLAAARESATGYTSKAADTIRSAQPRYGLDGP